MSEKARMPVGRRAVLRSWARNRWVAAAAVSAAATAVIAGANGLFDPADLPAHAVALLLTAAGAGTAGLLAASYISTPNGAAATVCDLRWPIFGLAGLSLATTSSPDSLLIRMFPGLPPALLSLAVQPALGVLSVALMAAALTGRLALEGRALSDPAQAACATCVPLRPTK